MAEAQGTGSAVLVRTGIDRFDQLRNVGPNSLKYKVVGRDTGDRLFILRTDTFVACPVRDSARAAALRRALERDSALARSVALGPAQPSSARAGLR